VPGDTLEELRDRIRLLAAVDRGRQVFGAGMHDYRLAPPLSEPELTALEARFGALPVEYRRFVGTVGAHGAGPYYGLVPTTAPDAWGTGREPDPARPFARDAETAYDAPLPVGMHLLDGTLVLAEQGRGGRSLLVIRGPRAGEVWSDWTREHGTVAPEAPGLLAWYARWLERALLEWLERAAPAIALDGPTDPAELEAAAYGIELAERLAPGRPGLLRTLGYLHLRERRWADADAAFAAAAAAGGDEPAARLALDRARLALVRGAPGDAIAAARLGLITEGLWYATRDDLLDALERALAAAGRADEALAVLEERAAARHFSLDLHHRLARERLARHDVGGAGAALERAARMAHVLGGPQPFEARVPASFDPIIAELRAAGRRVDADALAARASLILDAN
jgi:hypothetical protein